MFVVSTYRKNKNPFQTQERLTCLAPAGKGFSHRALVSTTKLPLRSPLDVNLPSIHQIEANTEHGKVESKERFPLFHTPDDGGITTKPRSALTGLWLWTK